MTIFLQLLKAFAILICATYIYSRLLRTVPSIHEHLSNIATSMLLSLLYYESRKFIADFSVIIFVSGFVLLITMTDHEESHMSIDAAILAITISYIVYITSSVIVSIALHLFGISFSINSTSDYILLILLLQILILCLLCRIKRFKRGMPFLSNRYASRSGVMLGVLTLVIIGIINCSSAVNIFYAILSILVQILGLALYFWWRDRLTKTYREKLQTDELQRIRTKLLEKDAQIETLRQNNDALAKIIHRDNKLIPALALAVRDFIDSAKALGPEELQKRSAELLQQLDAMTIGRRGILEEYTARTRTLPAANVLSTDSLMNYMLGQAQKCGVELELTLSGSVRYLTEKLISEQDLNTLLADLIENAIIATRERDAKRILVSIGIEGEAYQITVFDSGSPFAPEVLSELGEKQITTHGDDGGSGIGLITVFQILNKYDASFCLVEYPPGSIYTKKVSVIFDGKRGRTIGAVSRAV